MTNENLAPYVVITREQLEMLLTLAKVANISFHALNCEGIPLSTQDYQECFVDCNNAVIIPEKQVNEILNDLDITRDVDFRASLKLKRQ